MRAIEPTASAAVPMTVEEVRLEILAQVLVLGAAVTVARERVSKMAMGPSVELPSMAQCYRMVRKARADGTAAKISARWKQTQARRRKDADGVNKAEAIRLVVNERMKRGAAAKRLGVHHNTITQWLSSPEGLAALHTEARVSTLLGAMSLDDDIAKLREIADRLEDMGDLVPAAQVRAKAADIEVKRINGAEKVIVATQVQVNAPGATQKTDVLADGLAQIARSLSEDGRDG